MNSIINWCVLLLINTIIIINIIQICYRFVAEYLQICNRFVAGYFKNIWTHESIKPTQSKPWAQNLKSHH